ncbi:MAG: hypothetical protein RDV41_16055 [Planctomycetota bacterium]|nr:hypothetical protein [Planctomycetota bacterium]
MPGEIFILGSVAGGAGKTAVGVNLLSCLTLAGKEAVLIDTSPYGALGVPASRSQPRGGSRSGSLGASNVAPAQPLSVCPFPCFTSDENGLRARTVPLAEDLSRGLFQLLKNRGEAHPARPSAPSVRSESDAGGHAPAEGTKALKNPTPPQVCASLDKGAPLEQPYVIVDCVSTIDMLIIAEHAVRPACILVARPRESERAQLGAFLASVAGGLTGQACKVGAGNEERKWRIVVNGYDAADPGQLEVLAAMEREFQGRLCKCGIPNDPAVGSALEKGLSAVVAAPASPAAVNFTRLARELFGTL